MTLLILEIKIPSTDDVKNLGTVVVLKRLIPSFIGFLISFLVTALYWRAHLTLAQSIKSYDNKLLWYTVWLLMMVVLLPFSTAFYVKNFNYNGPFVVYCINLVLMGAFNFFMLNYVVRKEGYTDMLTKSSVTKLRFRSLCAPLIWGLSALWVLVEPTSARFLFILIFVVQAIGERIIDKRELINNS